MNKEYIEFCNRKYQEGDPIISDNEYDALLMQSELMGLDVTGITTSGIEGKVDLPVPMASMNKAKDKKCYNAWLAKNPPPYVITAKMDGISLIIDGSDMYTRGCGFKGINVKWIKEALSLPDSPENYIVRGELIINTAVWKYLKDNNITTISSPLSYVSGIANRTTPDNEKAETLDFIAFQLIDKQSTDSLPQSKQYSLLEQYGYETPLSYLVEDVVDWQYLQETLDSIREESKYNLDGIIIISDHKQSRIDKANPTYAIAFKDSILITSTVVDIEWDDSKTGKLYPIVVFEPIFIGDTKRERASGKNAKFIADNKITIGSVISMAVISTPSIVAVDNSEVEDETPYFPTDEYEWRGSDIYLTKFSQKMIIKQMVYLLETLDAPNMKFKTVEKLYNKGLTTIKSMILASESEWKKILGKISGPNNRSTTISALANGTLINYMAGSWFFDGMGVKVFESVLKTIPYSALLNEWSVKGIGKERRKVIVDGLQNFDKWYNEIQESLQSIGVTANKIREYTPPEEDEETVYVCLTGNPSGMSKKEFCTKYNLKEVSIGKADMLITDCLNSQTNKMTEALSKNMVIETYQQIMA